MKREMYDCTYKCRRVVTSELRSITCYQLHQVYILLLQAFNALTNMQRDRTSYLRTITGYH